jgi:hypothetical protein
VYRRRVASIWIWHLSAVVWIGSSSTAFEIRTLSAIVGAAANGSGSASQT